MYPIHKPIDTTLHTPGTDKPQNLMAVSFDNEKGRTFRSGLLVNGKTRYGATMR